MQPIIGITCYSKKKPNRYFLPGHYIDAVRKAGGLPILLLPGETNVKRILQVVDGIIFAGGGGIDPGLYGGKSHPSITRIDKSRDSLELALANAVFETPKPVFGICRGFQLLAVATGSDLVAHIPDDYGNKVRHRAANGKSVKHYVEVMPQSRLTAITGSSKIKVESMHHQAARTISSEWEIVANSADGIAEAIEHRQHKWMLAVLWHPELSLDDQQHLNIFKTFVESCRKK